MSRVLRLNRDKRAILRRKVAEKLSSNWRKMFSSEYESLLESINQLHKEQRQLTDFIWNKAGSYFSAQFIQTLKSLDLDSGSGFMIRDENGNDWRLRQKYLLDPREKLLRSIPQKDRSTAFSEISIVDDDKELRQLPTVPGVLIACLNREMSGIRDPNYITLYLQSKDLAQMKYSHRIAVVECSKRSDDLTEAFAEAWKSYNLLISSAATLEELMVSWPEVDNYRSELVPQEISGILAPSIVAASEHIQKLESKGESS